MLNKRLIVLISLFLININTFAAIDSNLLPSIAAAYKQQSYIKASNTGAADEFGYAIRLSGNTMVVGAPFEDDNALNSGKVYVYIRSVSGVWTQQASLKPSSVGANYQFGSSVAIDGDTLVVGSIFATGSNSTTGLAYVFTRTGSTWTQQAILEASNADYGDYFGESIAIDGNSIIIGASREESNETGVNSTGNDNSFNGAGAAYIFVRSGSAWSQQAYLKASNSDIGDLFGTSVDISGNTAVVGAFNESSNAIGVGANQSNNLANSSGAAYVFYRSGSTWVQQAYLKASNTDENDQFGSAVSVSGSTIIVGAPGEASTTTGINGDQSNNSSNRSGAVYIFNSTVSGWQQQAYLKASRQSDGFWFGNALSLDGEDMVVGAFQESDPGFLNNGGAFVFSRSNGIWSQQSNLIASNKDDEDYFGQSVAISGDYIAVGANQEDSNQTGIDTTGLDNSFGNSGATYVFDIGFSVGGTVSGLESGDYIKLKNNSTDEMSVENNISYVFNTALADTDTYNVTVSVQPFGKMCTVSNASGTINAANVTNVNVICAIIVPDTYTIGGIVSGMSPGDVITLWNKQTYSKVINANGAYTFDEAYDIGETYAITTSVGATQLTCTVENAGGTISNSNITNVNINCITIAPNTFRIQGTVNGLDIGNTVTIQNNLGDDLLVSASTTFSFVTPLNDGSTYSVTVLTQPNEQMCIVVNGTGTVAGHDIGGIDVNCVTNTYSIGGSVLGLGSGKTVELKNLSDNSFETLTRTANGVYTFNTELTAGNTYLVSVITQPVGQTCQVNNASGTIIQNNINNITVICSNNQGTTYTVGGSLTGMDSGKSIQLRNSPNEILTINANDTFTFVTAINNGAAYTVSVQTHPNGQYCTVSNATGVIANNNVTSVIVNCINEALFDSGFESSLKILNYLDELAKNNPESEVPRYDFESDSLVFKGYILNLENDYESKESLEIMKYWLKQIILLENLQIKTKKQD